MRQCYHMTCDNSTHASEDKYNFLTNIVQTLVLAIAEMSMENYNASEISCISETLEYLSNEVEEPPIDKISFKKVVKPDEPNDVAPPENDDDEKDSLIQFQDFVQHQIEKSIEQKVSPTIGTQININNLNIGSPSSPMPRSLQDHQHCHDEPSNEGLFLGTRGQVDLQVLKNIIDNFYVKNRKIPGKKLKNSPMLIKFQ